ncbi:hypothetical protein AB0O64_14420 [Streptomyces sp. NPDC088341]|uniref:phage tail protein n=1 Tax=Streptomyces sp. NPDC088341 TaxID=3154870 RepID=UPI003442DD0C
MAARTAATRQTPHADVSRSAVSHADVPHAGVPDSLSDTGTTTPAVSPTGPELDVRSVRRLQAGAGNAAVARLVAQRYAEVVKPPPSQAPGFRRVRSDVAAKQTKLKRHRPAAVESRSAQDAALAPPDDRQAQGKAANAEKMNEAKPGEFDKGAFIGAVNEAIAAQAPKNLEEADGFADSGRADSIKDSVDGKVKDGKESSAEEIETATTAAPDTSRAKEKQVTPMSPDQPPGNPGAPSAADAVPARQPDEVLDFSEGPRQVDQQMADAEVTEEQLARGNEPQFDRALAEKKKGEQQTAAVPARGRAAEAEQLSAAKAGAAVSGAQAMNAMTAERGAAGRAVDSGKGETKSADEKKREQVTARLQKVFDATQKDVEKILGDLDGKVDRQFTEGEKRARDDFTADHKRRMKEYKDRRYSGWRGPFRWGRDKLKGLPQEGLDIFKKSRELYVTKMQAVISTIADTIGTELGRAKVRIAAGRDELKAEVDRLPADLRQFGEEAAADFAGKFDDLESQVDDKSQELVQTLAQKYTEALNSVDEEIKKLEEENKGLIAMVVDAVVGVIQTIMELKNLLMGVLAKSASVITKIIKDPIGFLRNLVSSVGAGLNLFIGNIADHLKTGLVSWLLGTAVSTGLAIPSRFDLKGIIQLIASLLGLTWDNIRARITRKGVPEQAMAKVEQSVPVAGALAREGPAGAAQEITAETGDLKTTILDDLKSYLIPTVLIAGITWILSLLNPASAFIRAVKAIIDIVTFIVTQGAQIAAFVNAVLDAVIAIANGAKAGVPKAIETALATSIPLLIGLLASLLGIGGLANKVRQAFQKVSRPVNRAIDKLVDKIAKAGKRLWSKTRGTKEEKSKDLRGSKEDAQARSDLVRAAVKADIEAQLPRGVDPKRIEPTASAIYDKHAKAGLKALEIRPIKNQLGAYEVLAQASALAPISLVVVGDPEDRFDTKDIAELFKRSGYTAVVGALRTHIPGSHFLRQTALGNHRSGALPATRYELPADVDTGNSLGSFRSKSSTRHAEVALMENFQARHDRVMPIPPESYASSASGLLPPPRALVMMKVTRSPCPACAEKISELKRWGNSLAYGDRNWSFNVRVSALGVYTPSSGEGLARLRGRIQGLLGIIRLHRAGISISAIEKDDNSLADVTLTSAERKRIEKKIDNMDAAVRDLRKLVLRFTSRRRR